jgi:small conductance mechanosensitive channel
MCSSVDMHQELTSQVEDIVRLYLIPMAWKVSGGLAVWVIGNYAIKFLRGGLRRTMRMRHLDVTLSRYLDTSATVVLQLLVLIAVLGVLGVETTSFAALLAAAGIAIGAAWSGLLSNFAAGLFLLTFRPFRVGDTIAAGGITGTVREIGLFVTSIDTPDHVLTFVGNTKLFSDNVQNFSANDFRRVDLTAQLPPVLDIERAMASLRSSLTSIPHVLTMPKPDVEILTITPAGCTLAVRPCCHNDHYWQVYFDTNRVIGQMLTAR